jgi:2-polyprenyl-3-methyl-5-hydroxy-6-metoxy-1,4-benzoquinol methylase
MNTQHVCRGADPDADLVRAFYDGFADSRMSEYLQQPNLRIEKAIARIMPMVTADAKVLEIGCGIGLVTEHIASAVTNGSVWACDISGRNIAYAQKRVQAPNAHFRRIDILREFHELRTWIAKPLQLVIMVDVLEHLPLEQHSQLLGNLRGVMDQDSTLVLTFPSAQYQNHLRQSNPGELQIIDEVIELSYILDIARAAGFSIKHFSLEDVWLRNQYVHCLLTTSTALAPIHEISGFRAVLHEIGCLIPSGERLILVDEAHWLTEELDGRIAIPFLERDGCYWGEPADIETAKRELERLRHSGAHFMVFASPSFWWLDYYSGLDHYLRSNYRCILENDHFVVFDLRSGEPVAS